MRGAKNSFLTVFVWNQEFISPKCLFLPLNLQSIRLQNVVILRNTKLDDIL